MELPEAVKKVGIITDGRVVYMEEYVLRYLKACKTESMDPEDGIILYGRKDNLSGTEFSVICAACSRSEDSSARFADKDRIGCVNREIWKREDDGCSGILLGDAAGGQPIEGYYIFYAADEEMEEYLAGRCLKRQEPGRQPEPKEREPGATQPELTALSSGKDGQEGRAASPYLGIRIAVVCIFIIFCAIAVTTLNGFDKMSDFVQTAVQTVVQTEVQTGAQTYEKN